MADGLEIGDEIALLLLGKAELEYPVEMLNDLLVGLVTAVMEVGRVEIRVDQGP